MKIFILQSGSKTMNKKGVTGSDPFFITKKLSWMFLFQLIGKNVV